MLRKAVGDACKVPVYLTFADPNASAELKRRRRQTLYIGLSDGARIDLLRRANAGTLINDQIVLAAHIDHEKWEDLSSNLATDLVKLGGTGEALFRNVVLIDDFTASGTTFVRKKDNGKWTGKIYKFFCRRRNAQTVSREQQAFSARARCGHACSPLYLNDPGSKCHPGPPGWCESGRDRLVSRCDGDRGTAAATDRHSR
jgi:hypothetical protein